MSPYGCISSGDMQGIIEVVDNSETIGSIFSKSLEVPGKTSDNADSGRRRYNAIYIILPTHVF